MKGMMRFSVFVVVLGLIFSSGVGYFNGNSASANSGPSFWSGATGSGIYTKDCPVIVSGECLTFDVRKFPEPYYESEEEYLAYDGKVTAEYTFVNPTDEEISVALYFPFGTSPAYVWSEYAGRDFRYADDTGKYVLKADGKAVDVTVRHSYAPTEIADGFEFVAQSEKLLDDYKIYDDFYAPHTPVYAYTYEIKEVDAAAENAFAFAEIFTDGSTMRVLCDYRIGELGDDRVELGFNIGTGRNITLYTVGESLSDQPNWKFYRNGYYKNRGECSARITLVERTETTFADLILSCRPNGSNVSDVDYYNAMLDYRIGDSTALYFSGDDDLLSRYLMRWYSYTLNFAAGQTIVNTVTAPIYPMIRFDTDPCMYEHTYLISPAAGWADFRDLEINILTDSYLLNDTRGFAKTETGYRVAFDVLPDGELNFSLCSSDSPQYRSNAYGVVWIFLLVGSVILFYVLPVALILGLAVWAIVYACRKRKRR